jgi:hypothetical protein
MLAARVRTVRVQAVAATVNNKTVLAPPYNVLITGSTKGKVCCTLVAGHVQQDPAAAAAAVGGCTAEA